MAWEIDYKSRTVDGKYNADTRINNSEFFKSEFPKYAPALVEDINNVIFNLKNIEELGAIQKSKYVQSNVGDSFKAIKSELDAGEYDAPDGDIVDMAIK